MVDKQIEALRSISSSELFSTGVLFIGLVAPGYLGMFVFAPQLLKDLSFVTTLFLSISFSVPMVLSVVAAIGGGVETEKQMDHALYYSIGVLYLPFYIWLLLAATFDISWQIFIWALVFMEAALVFYCRKTKQTANEEIP